VRGWIHERSRFAWRVIPLIRSGYLMFTLTNEASDLNVTEVKAQGGNVEILFGSRYPLVRIHHRGASVSRGSHTIIIPSRSMSPSSYVLSTFAQDVERNVLLPIIDEAIRG